MQEIKYNSVFMKLFNVKDKMYLDISWNSENPNKMI